MESAGSGVRSGFIQICGMEVCNQFRHVREFCGENPQSFFVSPFVTCPLHQVQKLTRTSLLVALQVKDFGNFELQFSVDNDWRWRQLDTVRDITGFFQFQHSYMEYWMYRSEMCQKP